MNTQDRGDAAYIAIASAQPVRRLVDSISEIARARQYGMTAIPIATAAAAACCGALSEAPTPATKASPPKTVKILEIIQKTLVID
jgi:hypothetical protein